LLLTLLPPSPISISARPSTIEVGRKTERRLSFGFDDGFNQFDDSFSSSPPTHESYNQTITRTPFPVATHRYKKNTAGLTLSPVPEVDSLLARFSSSSSESSDVVQSAEALLTLSCQHTPDQLRSDVRIQGPISPSFVPCSSGSLPKSENHGSYVENFQLQAQIPDDSTVIDLTYSISNGDTHEQGLQSETAAGGGSFDLNSNSTSLGNASEEHFLSRGIYSNLEGCCWLNDVTVNDVLATLTLGSDKVEAISSHYVLSVKRNKKLAPPQLSRRGFSDTTRYLAVPLCHGDHWTFAWIDLASGIINHYNSMANSTYFRAAQTALTQYASMISQRYSKCKDLDWIIRSTVYD